MTTTPSRPLVVVPGLFGSEISYTGGSSPIKAWPATSAEDLNYLSMNTDGTAAYSTEVTGLTGSFTIDGYTFDLDYQKFVKNLETYGGYEKDSLLFEAPYDWRYDLLKTAQPTTGQVSGVDTLGAVIAKARQAAESQFGTSKVDLVCHSMGCLATFVYLIGNSFDNIENIIFLAPPFWGTVEAYKRVIWGSGGLPWDKWIELHRKEWKKLILNMPGIYELCPSEALTNDELKDQSFLTFNGTTLTYPQSFGLDSSPLYGTGLINETIANNNGYVNRIRWDKYLLSNATLRDNLAQCGFIIAGSGNSTDKGLDATYTSGEYLDSCDEETGDGDKNVLNWGYDKVGISSDRICTCSGLSHMEMITKKEIITMILGAQQNGKLDCSDCP